MRRTAYPRRPILRTGRPARHNPPMRKRSVGPVLVTLLLAATAGCESGLVSGYQPRRLGDSPAARRAYYAGKFTPEAQAAERERAEELRDRAPTPAGAPAGPRGD